MKKEKADYSALKDITILVVEDNEDELEELCELLNNFFAKCFKAKSGKDGVKQYAKYHPDIVLTDLGMPNMDGFEMSEKIREINKDVSVVLHTIFTNVDIFLKAIEHKISRYVIKPTNAKLLLDALLKESQNVLKEKILKKRETLIKTIANEFPDPMMVVDLNYNVLYANKSIKNNKYWHSSKCYQFIYNYKYPCDLSGQSCDNVAALRNNSNIIKSYEKVDEKGNRIYFNIKTIPLRDENEKIYAFLKITQDKTAEKKREIELEQLASHDALTNLPNRFLLLDRLGQAILRSNRNKKKFAFMFIDLDNFKIINDSFGHCIGDEVLKIVALRMQSLVRKIDTVARLGGDEFVVILESVFDKKQVINIAQDILDKLKQDFELKLDLKINISCTIGIDIYDPKVSKKSKEQLIQNADIAMYKAKKMGKGNFRFFTEENGVG